MIGRKLMRRLARGGAAVVATSMLLTGCDFDVYEMPLPGGTDTGDDPIVVDVYFADVLDLVPKSTVKVNDVSVGQVTAIELEGYTARVTLELRSDVELPDNAVAELRQTSLLGEKFVALSAPEEGASEELLESGDDIPIERTGRNPEVEEVLGALSLLLNGGGVAQFKTIASELNKALEGREGAARSVLQQIDELMGQFDAGKEDIVDAIESLNRLAIAVNDQRGSIDLALEELPSALTSLDKQRRDLVRMLRALNKLGDVGVRVIKASKAATIESFEQLLPVVTELANSGDNFVKAFHVFLTYPFVDEVVGRDPQVARNLHMGDFTNLSIQMDLTIDDSEDGTPTPPTDLPSDIDPTVILDNITKCLQSGDIESKACQKVVKNLESLEQLREECQEPENEDKDVCKQLNLLPGVPGSTGGGPLDPIGGGILRPAPRTGFGPTADWSSTQGPTMRQLAEVYDPGLVSLLVPGMVVDR